ncbi:MAG: hypothetical protein JXB24_09160 [Bacteroidales bacterium]|nr:hypothetical protein [Bacteroidales bacterium]
MENSETKHKVRFSSLIMIIAVLLFVFPVSAFSDDTGELVKFKPEYKIKRISGGTVTIYTYNNEGDKEEYIFKDFNADVVLSIYRRIKVSSITSNLAKKYYLSEAESRRSVKRVLNVLDHWGMLSR